MFFLGFRENKSGKLFIDKIIFYEYKKEKKYCEKDL
jgi:hypothetical protein